MKVRLKVLIVALGFLPWCSGTRAIPSAAAGGGYEDIVTRNVFGLKPIPQPGPPPDNTPPPPKIELNGITTILGDKIALLKAHLPAVKPGDKPQEQLLTLSEGQREGNIEVLEVDEKAGRVKVRDYGTIIELAFAKPEVNPSVSQPSPNPPSANGAINPGMRNMPTRFPRRPQPGATPLPGAAAEQSPTMPGAVMPAPANTTSPQSAAQAGALTPEEQAIIQQLEQEQRRSNQPLQPQ